MKCTGFVLSKAQVCSFRPLGPGKFQTTTVRPTNVAETLHGLADSVGMLEVSALAQAERIKELEQELIDVNAELVEIQQSHQIISEELREARFRNH